MNNIVNCHVEVDASRWTGSNLAAVIPGTKRPRFTQNHLKSTLRPGKYENF